MNAAAILKNEKGALMILVSVMLLALLTIISIAASKTANIELKIAGNEYLYQRCFYNAEGAIMETVDFLIQQQAPREISLNGWVLMKMLLTTAPSSLIGRMVPKPKMPSPKGPSLIQRTPAMLPFTMAFFPEVLWP